LAKYAFCFFKAVLHQNDPHAIGISAVQRDGMSMVARSGVGVVEISIMGEAGSA
jgi:hypothetical protein